MYERGAAELKKAGTEDAEFDALHLCLTAVGISRTEFLLNSGRTVSEDEARRFYKMISEREDGRPLQYIIGEQSFFGRSFAVGEGVLIPRPETEQLADICIGTAAKNGYKTVFDLCAGTGCIGITVACECPQTDVYLFELFDGAFEFLEKNSVMCGDGRVHPIRCDVLDGMPDGIPAPDMIVSNPPYIMSGDIPALQKEVLREPHSALDGGAGGLVFYEAIAEKWLPHLKDGGFAAVECGEGQSDAVSELFSRYGKAEKTKDFYGADRFVTVTKTSKGEKKNDNNTV